MSVGVPGPRPTLGHNLVTSQPVRIRIDPNGPNVTIRPMSEMLATEGLETSYFETTSAGKRRATCALKDETGKDDEGKDENAATPRARPRGFLKRLFGLR